MVALANTVGTFGNQRAPHYITGAHYMPIGYTPVTTGFATTVNRCYYFPMPIFEAHTFTACVSFNSGAGDNTETYRCMVFSDDGANGGPGTLAKDFGEVTLTAAAAARTLTSNWAATPGMWWGAMWFSTAASMYGASAYWAVTGVGGSQGPGLHNYLGFFAAGSYFGTADVPVAHYVDTAYGAAPATAVAPTATIASAFATQTAVIPMFVLKA